MSKIFVGKWICPHLFEDLVPRNMYHKEHSPCRFELGENDPKNLHVMFKKRFNISLDEGRYILRVSADDYGKFYVNGAFVG